MEKRKTPSIFSKSVKLMAWLVPSLGRMPKTTPFMAMANRITECMLDGITCVVKASHEPDLKLRLELIEAFIDNMKIVQGVWMIVFRYSSDKNAARIISPRQNMSFVTMMGEIERMATAWAASTEKSITAVGTN